MAKNTKDDLSRLSYEQAFSELEHIVDQLETETSNLDESLALFEKGQMLSKRCAELLEQAELKVKKLLDIDLGEGD